MNKKINSILGAMVVSSIAITSMAVPAFAQTVSATAGVGASVTGSGVTVKASVAGRIKNIVTRADEEITRRITALNALDTRVNAMEKLSATEKTSLSSNIQTQLSAMSSLQTQISADAAANNTSSLVTDAKSITASYRIFALILPQGAIEAASDRVLTTQSIMADLGTKFSTRISAAQSAGNNVTAASAALADFNAKVSDSNTQAQVAASEVSTLTPDSGNATVEASNTATLKDAHAKIVASQQDLIAARADAGTIIKALASFKVSASANASTSTR